VEKISRMDNRNSFISIEPQEVSVSRYNEVRLAGKSTGKDVVIRRVLVQELSSNK
jgi:hypothetical protein